MWEGAPLRASGEGRSGKFAKELLHVSSTSSPGVELRHVVIGLILLAHCNISGLVLVDNCTVREGIRFALPAPSPNRITPQRLICIPRHG